MPTAFTKPIAFIEALKSSRIKKLLPTSMSSAELSKLDAAIRERARFMARVNHVGTLAQLDQGITDLLDPAKTDLTDSAQLRLQMKQQLRSIGYDPENPPKGFEPAKPGSLKDISSDARLNLTIDTNIRMAHGYGRFVQANDADILDDWPCWEFVRDMQRKEPRQNWTERWVRAGGQLYGYAHNRMIATKDSPVWTNLSVFDLPYPPFDYNSGMGVEEVSRDEAEELGVIKSSTVVQPQTRNLNDKVEAALPQTTNPNLSAALDSIFTIQDGRILFDG